MFFGPASALRATRLLGFLQDVTDRVLQPPVATPTMSWLIEGARYMIQEEKAPLPLGSNQSRIVWMQNESTPVQDMLAHARGYKADLLVLVGMHIAVSDLRRFAHGFTAGQIVLWTHDPLPLEMRKAVRTLGLIQYQPSHTDTFSHAHMLFSFACYCHY